MCLNKELQANMDDKVLMNQFLLKAPQLIRHPACGTALFAKLRPRRQEEGSPQLYLAVPWLRPFRFWEAVLILCRIYHSESYNLILLNSVSLFVVLAFMILVSRLLGFRDVLLQLTT